MIKKYCLLALVVLALSCSVKEESSPLCERVTFEAVLCDKPATKTVLQADGSVFWSPGDAINLFYGENGAAVLTASNTDAAAQTSFTGMLDGMLPNGTDEFWAVYPYAAGNTFDGSAVILTLPDEQTGVAGTFANNLFISLAKSQDYTLQFYNLCGGIKFSVSQQGIQSVTFKGNNEEILAGQVQAQFDDNGKPVVHKIAKGATELRLNAPDGGFEVGKWYYIVSLPATLSAGYTMTFYSGRDVVAERVTDTAVTIKRSVWGRLTEADDVPEPFEASKYLEFTSVGTTKIALDSEGGNDPILYYSTDAENWTLWDYDTLTVSTNHPVYICGDNPEGFSQSTGQYSVFASVGDNFSVSGDVMSLINYKEDVLAIPNSNCFFGLFAGSKLVSPPSLPATTLTDWCYNAMFYNCSSLTSAPILPATVAAYYCYSSMFYGCTALTSAPELPATTLDEGCYQYMFYGCTALTSAPELPVTTLAKGCYYRMMANCSGLTSAPEELPATTLTQGCYYGMFQNCTSLVTAPELPATTLAASCYRAMFYGCSSLTAAPDLPATELAEECYYSMFTRCSGLTQTPASLPATTLATSCYYAMFYACSQLTTAPELPATTLAERCYESMFYECSSLITAPELPATTLTLACYHWMFHSCTSLTTAPDLPATTLTEDCYNCMFYNCPSLMAAPDIPATTVAPYCCYAMFSGGCTSLTTGPQMLPATTLAESCYQFMFWGCSSLTNAPELPATNLAPLCYYSMFERCSSLTTAPQLPATELAEDCYRYMFWSCTSLAEAPELPATALTKGCYYNMFGACESLETAPDLPATELADSCYTYMFSGSLNLKYVKALATNISASGCVDEWLRDVAANGTFIKSAQMNDWPTGISGIPEGWTVENDGATLISASKYLTFTSEGLTVIGMENVADNAPVLYYSEDLDTWKQWDYDTLHVKSSRPLYFCGNNPNGVSITRSEDIAYSSFTASGDYFSVSGDMMSLLDPNNDLTAMPSTGGFVYLFKDCSLLTSAPSLPATVLSYGCYAGLFYGCSNLTEAPVLPATEMKAASYIIMFSGCSSLTTAPELPATTLDDSCYSQMFEGCTSLAEAPELPATTLVQACYSGMFKDCTSLSRIVCKATDISAQSCLVDWVNNVSSQGTFVKSIGVQWPEGVSGIPEGWTVQDAEAFDLDGRWEALRNNDDPTSVAFVALFEGSNLDLYIIAWGQHYVGTYEFADGVITYTISEAYQAYTDVTFDEEGHMTSHSWQAGNLDASTLTLSADYDWYEMDAETLADYKVDLAEFSFQLQAGNTSATSALFGIENLVFTKVN